MDPKPQPKQATTGPLTASPDVLLRTIFSYVGRIADERDIDKLLILLADMGRDLISADLAESLPDNTFGPRLTIAAKGIDEGLEVNRLEWG